MTGDFPKWGPGWVVLGDVLAKSGEKKKAAAAYESALRGEGPVDQDAVRRKMAALR